MNNSVCYGYNPCKKIIIFVGSILLINVVFAHRCYVCGPNNADPNFNTSLIPSCDRFDSQNEAVFIRDCPMRSRGCSVQTNGTVLTRTCEIIAVDDCKIANQVKYCYCRTDLCNGKVTKTVYGHSDDEDSDVEGSGGPRNSDHVLSVPKITDQMATATKTPPILDVITIANLASSIRSVFCTLLITLTVPLLFLMG